MKIYFCASIRGGRNDKDIYLEIINYLKKYGKVLTEHVGNLELNSDGEKEKTDNYIHDRDLNWIKEADVVIAEVTTASLGVGYEIGKSENMNKNILCLYRIQDNKKLSAMISGSSKLTLKNYNNIDEAKNSIDNFLKSII